MKVMGICQCLVTIIHYSRNVEILKGMEIELTLERDYTEPVGCWLLG